LHILTKISVVVLVVLVLLAVPVFVTKAVVDQNYRTRAEELAQTSQITAAELQRSQLALRQLNEELQGVRQTAANQVDAQQRMVTTLRGINATLQAENRLKTEAIQGLETSLQGLQTNYEANLAQTTQLRGFLDDARKQITTLNTEIDALSSDLKEAQARGDRLEALARARQEQVQELTEQIEDLQGQLAAGGGAAEGTEAAPTIEGTVTGSVTAVRGDYASINLGSAKGIKEGMRLTIYRGGELVSNLRVDEVELQQAAGVIVDRRLDPMQGDKVTNEFNR
jgi:predicted  nucleic acid-binding Zn-ribbon protein